ncbi:MAG: hypothetical protein KIT84_00905 [Labilithrix sp.]|nr:hypothetical protein [Labilithrix sp.]MCW5809543.1 hypothetical protein [Labilithrix sp.]
MSSGEKYIVLASADAMGKGPFTVEEIAEFHRRGVFKDRTVIYNRYGSRRADAFTVKELLDGTKK